MKKTFKNPQRRRRLLIIIIIGTGIVVAASLVLYALRKNIDLYYTPTQVVEGSPPKDIHFRVGGLVEKGSVHYGQSVSFILTDTQHQITVFYQGILPDLFREGQGIVAQGHLNNKGDFIADEVLAKHDENYMPPVIASSASSQSHSSFSPSSSFPRKRESIGKDITTFSRLDPRFRGNDERGESRSNEQCKGNC